MSVGCLKYAVTKRFFHLCCYITYPLLVCDVPHMYLRTYLIVELRTINHTYILRITQQLVALSPPNFFFEHHRLFVKTRALGFIATITSASLPPFSLGFIATIFPRPHRPHFPRLHRHHFPRFHRHHFRGLSPPFPRPYRHQFLLVIQVQA